MPEAPRAPCGHFATIGHVARAALVTARRPRARARARPRVQLLTKAQRDPSDAGERGLDVFLSSSTSSSVREWRSGAFRRLFSQHELLMLHQHSSTLGVPRLYSCMLTVYAL